MKNRFSFSATLTLTKVLNTSSPHFNNWSPSMPIIDCSSSVGQITAKVTGHTVREASREEVEKGRITIRADYVPDEETELYFKAADVFVLPYRHIYQSGVLFLGYSFGLPVIAADVGALKDEILEGKTGFVFKPEDPIDLAATIERYFSSDLFANLSDRRNEIRDFALERHSWDEVGRLTMNVYSNLLGWDVPTELPNREAAKAFTR